MNLKKAEALFTYGTLQDKEVQQAVFGRTLLGTPDTLCGFRISEKKIFNRYPVIEMTKHGTDRVSGTVYGISQTELKMADKYEGAAYKRIPVILLSSNKAWVYVARND